MSTRALAERLKQWELLVELLRLSRQEILLTHEPDAQPPPAEAGGAIHEQPDDQRNE